MFGGIEGTPTTHKKYSASMEWLDRFVQIVVLRMVKSKPIAGVYEPNELGRKIIMNQLKVTVDQAGFNVQKPSTSATKTAKGTSRPPSGKSMIP
jgi:hypothetical protein